MCAICKIQQSRVLYLICYSTPILALHRIVPMIQTRKDLEKLSNILGYILSGMCLRCGHCSRCLHFNISGCMFSTRPFKFRWHREYALLRHNITTKSEIATFCTVVIILPCCVCDVAVSPYFHLSIAWRPSLWTDFISAATMQSMMYANCRMHYVREILFLLAHWTSLSTSLCSLFTSPVLSPLPLNVLIVHYWPVLRAQKSGYGTPDAIENVVSWWIAQIRTR